MVEQDLTELQTFVQKLKDEKNKIFKAKEVLLGQSPNTFERAQSIHLFSPGTF